MAQNLPKQCTNSIGIVLPGFSNQCFFGLIAQTVDVAKFDDYTILVGGDEDREPEALRFASRRLVDGLRYMAATGRLPAPTALSSLSIPTVAFDREPDQLELPTVQVGHRHDARLFAEHLSTGSRRGANRSGPGHLTVSQMRPGTYLQILTTSGFSTDADLVVEGDFNERFGAEAMAQFFALPEPPDAAFAANDLMVIGAMRYIHEHGLRVPADLKIAGFDGVSAARFASPGLTAYAQPIPTDRPGVTRLIELIEGGTAASFGDEPMLFEGALVIRESTISRQALTKSMIVDVTCGTVTNGHPDHNGHPDPNSSRKRTETSQYPIRSNPMRSIAITPIRSRNDSEKNTKNRHRLGGRRRITRGEPDDRRRRTISGCCKSGSETSSSYPRRHQ